MELYLKFMFFADRFFLGVSIQLPYRDLTAKIQNQYQTFFKAIFRKGHLYKVAGACLLSAGDSYKVAGAYSLSACGNYKVSGAYLLSAGGNYKVSGAFLLNAGGS